MLKRTIVAAAAALLLAVGATAALGGDSPAPVAPVEETEVSWTIKKGQCKNLPPGLKVTGEGTSRKYVTFASAADGTTAYTELVIITGTATDNRGGTYRFDYHNVLTTPDADAPFTAIMSDHFTLKGRGAANGLHSAFLANFTLTSEDPLVASLEKIWSTGDPIDFATGTARCDPL
jgi:hypothetical protein